MINLVIFTASIISFTAGASAVGSFLFWFLGIQQSCLPQKPFSVLHWGAGVSFLTISLTILGLCGYYNNPVLFGIWIFLLAVGTGYLISLTRYFRMGDEKPEQQPDWILIICQIGIWVFIVLCFMTVMTPETRHDPYDYHLMVPTLYLHAGKITEISWHVFSYMPKNTEILYGLALAVANDSTAKLIHFLFGCFGLIAIADWAQMGMKRAGSWLCVFLTVTLPLFGFIASSAYIDLALGFWQILALYCLAKLWDENNGIKPQWLYCMAFWFAGMALGTKYTAYAVFLPAFLICGLFSIRKVTAYRAITLIMASFILPLPSISWISVNTIWTLNPLYPLLPQFFGYHTPAAAEAYQFFRGHAPSAATYQLENVLPFLWTRLNALLLDGNALFLIGMVSICLYPILKKNKDEFENVPFQGGLTFYLLASSLAFFLATDNHDGRFFYGTLALLSIPASQLLMTLHMKSAERGVFGKMLVPVILLFFFLNGLSYRFGQLTDQRETIFPVLTNDQRDDWLSSHFPDYSITAWANINLPDNAKALGMGYPLRRNFVSKNKYGYVPGWDDTDKELSPDEIIQQLSEMGFTHILVPNDFFMLPDEYASPQLHILYQNRGKTLYQLGEEP